MRAAAPARQRQALSSSRSSSSAAVLLLEYDLAVAEHLLDPACVDVVSAELGSGHLGGEVGLLAGRVVRRLAGVGRIGGGVSCPPVCRGMSIAHLNLH
jgi:hypothetical protein